MKRVLIVDDSKSVRNAASKMLGNEFDVATAEDGEEAWSMLGFDPSIQVVFTDLNMPQRNGYELIRSIRTAEDARLRALPVIVVTGVDQDDEARAQSLELGATDFITKPFSSLDLLARARAHANYQQVTQDLSARTTVEPLTGLANNAGFLARLQQDMAYAQRHEQPLSLAILEIDGFRTLFLKLGKQAAERLLVEFAGYLTRCIRKEDTAARIGLGEFALSLPGGDLDGVERLLDKAQRELLTIWSAVNGGTQPPAVRRALIQPHVDGRSGAQDALDQCRKQLAIVRDERHAAAPSAAEAAHSAAAPPVTTLAAPAANGAAHAVNGAASAANGAAIAGNGAAHSLRLDPLLDAIDHGDTEPARQDMRSVVRRLVPLFRVLTPRQRMQLIDYLKQLGA